MLRSLQRKWSLVAKATVKLPEDMLKRMSKLGSNMDKVAKAVLTAGGEVVFSKAQSNLKAVIGSNTAFESRSTGELEDSFGVSDVLLDKNGNYNIKIGFSEPRSDGGSNAKIANIIEYGKSGQPAKPFLKPAQRATKKACIDTMKSTFESEVEKL